jgi:hypothetical protein
MPSTRTPRSNGETDVRIGVVMAAGGAVGPSSCDGFPISICIAINSSWESEGLGSLLVYRTLRVVASPWAIAPRLKR